MPVSLGAFKRIVKCKNKIKRTTICCQKYNLYGIRGVRSYEKSRVIRDNFIDYLIFEEEFEVMNYVQDYSIHVAYTVKNNSCYFNYQIELGVLHGPVSVESFTLEHAVSSFIFTTQVAINAINQPGAMFLEEKRKKYSFGQVKDYNLESFIKAIKSEIDKIEKKNLVYYYDKKILTGE